MVMAEVPEVFAQLIPKFLDHKRQEIEQLSAAADRADFAALENVGHNLKGTGRAHGFPYVTELGRRIEHAARKYDLQPVRTSIRRLERYLDGLRIVYVSDYSGSRGRQT
ncbi:MAG: Hpt domain-containing protein [Acidobacteria bacterium]|nr:Hpt domain-containing protein [Acidobacteriota bacterium]MBI3281450.1 Hpt domain-containing protein [Acidobacteriota bacterium]